MLDVSQWPDGAELGPDGLRLRGRPAADLAAAHGTPLVVVDEEHVRARARAFAGAFDRALWAVKAFPAHALIGLAAGEGLGLLAATGGEVDACLRAGADPSRIVLHGNNKLDEELELALEEGLGLVVLDNAEEVARLERVAASRDRRQPVLLRIAPGIEVSSHAYVVTGAPDSKFGVPVAAGMALDALRQALAAPHLELRGIHVHVGSQLLDAAPYLGAVEVALDFLAEARSEAGFEAKVLDTGGGMGTRYTDERPPDPAELGRTIREAVAHGCARRGLPVPEVMGEPGRAVTSAAAVTLYRVGTIKEVPGIRTYVAVDGGMSDNIRPALYDSRYTVALASRGSRAEGAEVTVVGRHCESGDVLARDVALPSDLRRGDLLAFAGTGAYEYAMASTYNKVGRPAAVLLGAEGERPILRAEDASDLARLDVPEAAPTTAAEGVEVRTARPADARAVMRLIQSVAEEGRYIRTERLTTGRGGFRRRFRRSRTPDRADLVATVDGGVVGHLGIAREPGPALRHVATIGMSVRRDHRGRGVGSALLAGALEWARWARVEKVSLSVFPHNRAALGLYRKFGFSEEGRLRGHTKKSTGYEDEVVMARWVEEDPR